MELSLSLLLCDESDTDLEGYEATRTLQEEAQEVDDDYLNFLFNKEINDNGLQIVESPNDSTTDQFKAARLDAIEDISYIVERLGFRVETSYVAVTYMDRFLSIAVINLDDQKREMELLPIACVSLAIKVEECVRRMKPDILSFFPGKYKFTFQEVRRVENLVLRTLEWRMHLVSPFPFVHHFVSRLWRQNTSITVSKVIDVILKAIKDEMTTKWRPCIIAAAATLFMLDETLTIESLEQRIETLACRTSLNIEDIFSLYNRLKEEDARDSSCFTCVRGMFLCR